MRKCVEVPSNVEFQFNIHMRHINLKNAADLRKRKRGKQFS
jgi:hypothetical protein